MPLDPYAVLQVAPEADEAVISAAYRALARLHHPDIAGESTTALMQKINAAWEVLRDPVRRRELDRRLGHVRTEPREARGSRRPSAPLGTGAAGPPPGRPSGSVLPFGRHVGWSLGEIARVDPGYLEWLDQQREGRPYRGDIDAVLRRAGWRREHVPRMAQQRRSWFAR
jgi:curved DNA-binding protein CbpA